MTRRLPSPLGSAPRPAFPAVLSLFLGKGSHSYIRCHYSPCRVPSVCPLRCPPAVLDTLLRHTGGIWLYHPPEGKRQRITPRITDYCKLLITDIKAKKHRTSEIALEALCRPGRGAAAPAIKGTAMFEGFSRMRLRALQLLYIHEKKSLTCPESRRQ